MAANTDQFSRDSRRTYNEDVVINVSPHHQRPTKYPWPGRASALALVLGLALMLLIGFIVIADPFA
jgi:hypothetical protein